MTFWRLRIVKLHIYCEKVLRCEVFYIIISFDVLFLHMDLLFIKILQKVLHSKQVPPKPRKQNILTINIFCFVILFSKFLLMVTNGIFCHCLGYKYTVRRMVQKTYEEVSFVGPACEPRTE